MIQNIHSFNDTPRLHASKTKLKLSINQGFETVPFPGEEEATFHLQRSESGDARLSRERETVRVNQQSNYNTARPPKQPAYHKERDLLRGSSSSNFFNNKNGGKENDEDYEDTSPNRNADIPKKKIIRKLNRKEEITTTTTTQRATRPTGFANNFAGSPFVPSTTGKTTTTTSSITSDQYTTAIQNYRGRQRGRNYNNAENFRGEQQRTPTTPSYNEGQYRNGPTTKTEQFRIPSTQYQGPTTRNEQYRTPTTQNYNDRGQYKNNQEKIYSTQSTPAPFRQENRQYKPIVRQEASTSTPKFEQQRTRQNTQSPRTYPSTAVSQNNFKPTSQKTENYPTNAPFSKQTYNQYDIPKTSSSKQTENYPSTTNFNKKPTTFKSDNYPTTYSPKSKPQQFYQKQETSSVTPEGKSTQFDYTKQSSYDYKFQQAFSSTSRPTTVHTQYTPTVPKQSTPSYSTTQPSKFAKSFDYDDGSYNPKYDDEKYKEDEFLKTAHSQNFASSRNELSQSSKINLPIPTKESPRPFSATTPAPKPRTEKIIVGVKNTETKKEKNASYDYAYYDTNVGSEPEYDVGTEFERENIKKQ